jgi:hypothetical protein
LLFTLAVLAVAAVGVSAQTATGFAVEQAASETPAPEDPAATDEMAATDEAAATDEMMATEEISATDEMSMTEDVTATEEAAMGDPLYTGNGSAQVIPMLDQLDPEADTGFVRFAHVSPDSGPIDIYLNDMTAPLVTNLQLGEYTGAVRLNAGKHVFTARAAGSAADSPTLAQFDWELGSNSTWIIVAVGTQEEATFLLEPLNVLRNFSEQIARIRVINVNPYLNGLTVSVEGGEPLAEGLDWLGTADLDLTVGTQPSNEAGTVNMTVVDAEGNSVSEPVSLPLQPFMQYSILLASTSDPSVVTPIVITSPRDTTRVRFVSERQEAIEVLLMPAEQMLVEQLDPGTESEYFILPSEAATFAAYAPGTGPTGQNLAGLPVQLEPGYDITVTFRADGSAEVTETVFTDPTAMDEMPE